MYSDKETIDVIYHSKALKANKMERIGENYLLIGEMLPLSGKITDEDIYVYEEDEVDDGTL